MGVYSAGGVGLAASALLWLPLTVLALAGVGGRPLVEWVPLGGTWVLRRLTGGAREITRPVTRPGLSLPGVGEVPFDVTPTLGAALLVDRRGGSIVAVARVSGRGFVLDDPGTQAVKVDGWGRALAALGRRRAVRRVQLVLRTAQCSETSVHRWWRENAVAGGSPAGSVLADLMADASYATRRPEALLAIALRPPRGGLRRLGHSDVTTLEQELTAVADALRSADVDITAWTTPAQAPVLLRSAYDPATRPLPDTDVGSTAPPAMGIAESWNHVTTDGAVHAVYWIAEWPRSEVHPSFLQPLVLSPDSVRTITLIAEPLPIAASLREIRRAKAEHTADAAQRARIGQVEDESIRAELDDLLRREQELVAGHGDLRFTGLVTVSAPTLEELDAACSATEAAAAQALCEMRRLVGQQTTAHLAATVPLARGVL
nr:SCO6880 family protein [Actinotalea solisilvae]